MLGRGLGGKLAENATFLNNWEMQHKAQFLSGIAVRASAEIHEPAIWTAYYDYNDLRRK